MQIRLQGMLYLEGLIINISPGSLLLYNMIQSRGTSANKLALYGAWPVNTEQCLLSIIVKVHPKMQMQSLQKHQQGKACSKGCCANAAAFPRATTSWSCPDNCNASMTTYLAACRIMLLKVFMLVYKLLCLGLETMEACPAET